eukprot:215143_1
MFITLFFLRFFSLKKRLNSMEFKQSLKSLSTLQEKHKQEILTLLITILRNIIDHPTIDKYRNLNFSKLKRKFEPSIKILLAAGFNISDDNKRLIFDNSNSNELQTMYALLISHRCIIPTSNTMTNYDTSQSQINALMNEGFSLEEAQIGLEMSMKETINGSNEKKQENEPNISDSNKSVQILLSMGFEKELSLMALYFCNYDINSAVQFIINNNQKQKMIHHQQQRILFNTSDTNNSQLVEQISQQHNIIDFRRNSFYSNNLWQFIKNQAITNENASSNSCDLKQCCCLKQLATTLKKYHSILANHEKQTHDTSVSIDTMYDDNYSAICVLNDFHHLLSHHKNQFEEIYHQLMVKSNNCNPCKLSTCCMLTRSMQDPSSLRSKDMISKQIYYNTKQVNEIIMHHLLDKVHCYYFHTLDIGYKLSKDDKMQIQRNIDNDDSKNIDAKNDMYDNTIMQISKKIAAKRECYSQLPRLSRLNNSRKFITSHTNEVKYRNGFRYFYWDYYKNNNATSDNAYHTSGTGSGGSIPAANGRSPLKEWYIEQKYLSMKDEMLNNHICSLTSTSWQRLLQKAHAHIDTDIVKKIGFCSRSSTAKCYDMKYGTLMKLDHLIAMMIYCNYTELQRKFTETYRRMDEKECDEVMRARHSN